MLKFISHTERSVLMASALAFAAVLGWGSFAYSAFTSQGQVNSLTA